MTFGKNRPNVVGPVARAVVGRLACGLSGAVNPVQKCPALVPVRQNFSRSRPIISAEALPARVQNAGFTYRTEWLGPSVRATGRCASSRRFSLFGRLEIGGPFFSM